MMDKEKIEKAVELLHEAGLTACILLTMDEEHHGMHVEGRRWDLETLMMNALDDEDMLQIVATSIAVRSTINRNEEGGEE